MDTRKLDTALFRTVKAGRDDSKVEVLIRFKNPPHGNEPDLQNLEIRGADGKSKVLTANLSIGDIDTLSDWSEVTAISQSTTMHPYK